MKTLAALVVVGAVVSVLLGLLRSSPVPSAGPTQDTLVALVTVRDQTRGTSLRVSRDGTGRLRAERVVFAPGDPALSHVSDAAVRGALVGSELLVSAQMEDRGDLAFASSLWRLAPEGATRIVDDVALASRPLVVGRRAYVQRGRGDRAFISALDLDTAGVRTVAEVRGPLAYPVGVDPDLGLVAYVIGDAGTVGDGGKLMAFSLAGQRSVELAVVGTARDLSLVPQAIVDGKVVGPAIVYEVIRPRARSVELRTLTGEHAVLRRGSSTPLAPYVLPGGQLQTTYTAADGTLEVPRGFSSKLHALLLSTHHTGEPRPRWVIRSTDGNDEVALDPLVAAGERLEPIGFEGAQ